MHYLLTIAMLVCVSPSLFAQDAAGIIKKVDDNMISETQIMVSEMVIHGKRNNRVVTSKGYSEGRFKSFTEYLAPDREKGIKMLKLENNLWIYSPSTDRTIQLSGHMLRQSVMGSDLSYEDMMEDRKLMDMYNAKVTGEEVIDSRKTWVLQLNAKVDDVAYDSRKIWVDQERYVPLKEELYAKSNRNRQWPCYGGSPLKEELYAKSGQLLKKTVMSDIKKIDGRWYPTTLNYKDMLKDGKGTDFIVKEIRFNEPIPEYIFSKASLKK